MRVIANFFKNTEFQEINSFFKPVITDKHLLTEFWAEHAQTTILRIRIGHIIGSFIFVIFGFFDYLAKKNPNSNFEYEGFCISGHGEIETNAVSLELSDKQKYNISIQLKLYAPVKTKIYSDEKEDKPRLDSWETSIVIKNVTNGTTETNNKIIEALKKYFNLNGNWSITESAKKYNECITICCKGIKEVDNKAFIENTENLIKSLYNIEIDEISRLVNEIL